MTNRVGTSSGANQYRGMLGRRGVLSLFAGALGASVAACVPAASGPTRVSAAPTSALPPIGGSEPLLPAPGAYRMTVVATGRHLHEDGGGDRLVSTRYQPFDDFTIFDVEHRPDGTYRVRVRADGRYVHADELGDRLISTRYQVDDAYSRFHFDFTGPDVYRIRVKATGRFWHVDGGGDQLLSTRYQPDDLFTQFQLTRV